MKSILFTLLFVLAFITGYTQLYNSGGAITVQSGATLVIEGDYTSDNSGDIDIDGTVELKGDFINNTGTINAGSAGTLKFVGTAAQEIKGTASTTFNCDVEINNANGVSLTSADQVMAAALTLTSGKLTLNTYNLTLAAATVLTADASNYIVTNGAGQLKRPVGATDVAFPVGSATDYNPLVLNNAGTLDDYGVDFKATMPTGWTGTDHAVDGHWVVTEDVAGGSDLTVTAQWNLTDELTNFDRTDCAVGRQVSGDDVDWADSGPASGSDPYTRAGANFTDVGSFMVGDYFFGGIDVDLDFFLAGPYNVGTGSMNIGLNTKGLIPLSDPYVLGVTVSSIPSNVVDWILVQLRDKNDATSVLYSRTFFLDNTGNVIHTDGVTTNARFTGVPKDLYYVAVNHRNHLGVRTASTVDFSASNPSFNFKSNTGVFQNQSYSPQFLVDGSSNYGLYKGNVNGDAAVRKTGTPTINDYTALLNYLGTNAFILNVYAGADINMDGDVRKTGTPTINDYSALLNSLGTNAFILEQLP